MSAAILDFTAARQRITALAAHELEFTPHATLLERYRRSLNGAQLAELVHVALEESL